MLKGFLEGIPRNHSTLQLNPQKQTKGFLDKLGIYGLSTKNRVPRIFRFLEFLYLPGQGLCESLFAVAARNLKISVNYYNKHVLLVLSSGGHVSLVNESFHSRPGLMKQSLFGTCVLTAESKRLRGQAKIITIQLLLRKDK